jgi:hypothetical protein
MRKILLAVAFLGGLTSQALAQASFTANDAGAVARTFKSFNCASQICSLAVPADITGAAFGVTANPFFVAPGTGQTFPVSATALPLPAGAATQTTLASILTALGTPFQAGGSIGNTSFGISGTLPAYAAIPAFKIDQTTPGTTNLVSIGSNGTVNPATAASWGLGATAAAVPGSANYIGLNVAGNLVGPTGLALGATAKAMTVAIVDGSGNQITAFGGSGGTASNFGSTFPTSGTAIGLTNGTNMVPWSATSNYGTAPSAIPVPAINAFVTNTFAPGQALMATSSPVAIASNQSNLPVVNGASKYNTVAASQTAQALTGGGGGAAGDYLSHCMAFPTSTSPGAVTILDNATTIYAFPGGATSVSNLVPFALPVGALSSSGAWKVTTGANISVACVGKFT